MRKLSGNDRVRLAIELLTAMLDSEDSASAATYIHARLRERDDDSAAPGVSDYLIGALSLAGLLAHEIGGDGRDEARAVIQRFALQLGD